MSTSGSGGGTDSWSGRAFWRLFVGGVLAGMVATGARAQNAWKVEIPLRIAAYLPGTELGVVGPAHGRMRAGVLYGAGVELRRRDSHFGVRLAFVNPLTAGATFEPTPQCAGSCEPYRDPYPIFQAAALDLTARVRAGPTRVQLAVGPGLRSYHVPKNVCACGSPQPGQLQPFDIDDTRIVRHVSAEVRWPLKPFELGVQLEDYWGGFVATGHQQHDLVLGLGIHFR